MGGVEAPARYGLVDFARGGIAEAGRAAAGRVVSSGADGLSDDFVFSWQWGECCLAPSLLRLAVVEAGFGLLAVDYRGYGRSVGEPSEAGFYDDGRAMVAYAQGRLGLKPAQLVLYGESIGSGVAVQMATEMPAAGLVLQSPFASLVSVVSGKFPWVPVEWLLRDRFDSIGKMGRVGEPAAGDAWGAGRAGADCRKSRLFAAAGQPKEYREIAGYGHNDMPVEWMRQQLFRLEPGAGAHCALGRRPGGA